MFIKWAKRLGLCFRCSEQGHLTFECPNKAKFNFMKGSVIGAKMNQMNPTIEEVGKKGKCLMRCMVSSITHMHASMIKVMGKIGNQDVSFLIDSSSTHCFISLKFLKA